MLSDNAFTIIVSGAASATDLPRYLQQIRVALGPTPLRVWMTASAEHFVTVEVVSFYADEVLTVGDAVNPAEVAMRSRAIAVLPCTLNCLSSSALGLANTPTLTGIACFPGRVLFFASMRKEMWRVARSAGHIQALRERGHVIIDPWPARVYEFWQHDVVEGLGLLPPEEATGIIAKWDSGIALIQRGGP